MSEPNDESRGAYREAPTDEPDVVEVKKMLSTGPSGEAAPTQAIPSVICYCLASILMTVVNKYVVSGKSFNMNFLLLCIQSSVCVACVYSVKKAGVISFRDFDTKEAKMWFPISAMLVGVIYTGSKSLQFLSIPVYTIFKNLTIILIAYGEVIWFGGRVTGLTLVSFGFMVLSSIVAAWSDVSGYVSGALTTGSAAAKLNGETADTLTSNIGYLWMFLNCAVSASYVLTMRLRIKSTGFSDWDTMFYNNLLSIPILLVSSFVVEDWGSANLVRNFPPETRNFLLFAIAFSGAAAVGISFTTAWCIRSTSSTTYSMVGALNKLPVAASGMIFFGDVATFGSVSAIAIGFFAGVLYAVAKNNQKKAENAERGRDAIPMSNRK